MRASRSREQDAHTTISFQVSQQTLKDLVAEYKATGTAYRRRVHNVMRASFASHYRRMIPQLLEVLEFRSNIALSKSSTIA